MTEPTVRMEMTLNEKNFLESTRKMAAGWKPLTEEQKKSIKEAKELEKATAKLGREARKAFDESKTAAERYGEKIRMLNLAKEKGVLTERQHAQAVRYTKQQMLEAGRAGQAAFGPAALGAARSLIGALGLGGGVAGAVMLVTQGYQNWLTLSREITAETRSTVENLFAFASLQEPGAKRERAMQALSLNQRYGITDPGIVLDTVQAMQSAAGGSFQKGMERAETIFASRWAGINTETAKEIEIFGAGRGMAPGVALRMATIAGFESARTPETLAKIGPALSFWDDPARGFAAAATLTKTVAEGNLEVFTRRLAIGLGPAGPLQEYFAQAGLGEANAEKRIAYLRQQGKDTNEELIALGMGEIRERKAVVDIVRNQPDVERTYARIMREAKPGLLARTREELIAEFPEVQHDLNLGRLEAKLKTETTLSGRAVEDMQASEVRKARAIAARRLGLRLDAFGFPIISEGEVGAKGEAWARGTGYAARTGFAGMEGALFPPLAIPMAIRSLLSGKPWAETATERMTGYRGTGLEALEQLPALTEQILQEMRSMNSKTGPPPALGKPGVQTVNTANPEDR